MMFSMLFAPNTPDWLWTIVSILVGGSIFGMLLWGMILKARYTDPYTIVKINNREKWRRATILALIDTAMVPILGLTALTLSPEFDQSLTLLLFCGGLWIVVLTIAILYKRWEFERDIKNYQRIDRWIKDKSGFHHRVLKANPLTGLVSIFMTAEQKRFFSEGYPENTVNNDDNEPK